MPLTWSGAIELWKEVKRRQDNHLRKSPNSKNFGFSFPLSSSPPRSFHSLMGLPSGHISWDFITIFLLYSPRSYENIFLLNMKMVLCHVWLKRVGLIFLCVSPSILTLEIEEGKLKLSLHPAFSCLGEPSYLRYYLTLWGDKIQLRLKEKCKQGHMNKRKSRALVNN